MLVGIFGAFSYFFYFSAFITDDAFISFRTVDNFVRGYGLRWNIAERLQVFTSPLHTLLMSAVYWFTYDPSPVPNPTRVYLTAMGLSYVVSGAGILWLAWRAPSSLHAVAGFAVLMSSQAFVTFCSSGLETPVVHLLVIVFYTRFLQTEPPTLQTCFALLGCGALAVVNRIDTALLFLPACIYLVVDGTRRFGRRVWRAIVPASIPLVAWFGFSLVYFGFLFPNTYYAKIFGADPSILRQMGAAYLRLSFYQDPITLAVIACGIAVSVFGRRTALAGLSSLLYVIYVFEIGGDFIAFRFLAPPFLLSTLLILQGTERFSQRRSLAALCAAVIALALYGVVTPSSPLRAFRDLPKARNVRIYFPGSRLALWAPGREFPFARYERIRSPADCRAKRAEGPLTKFVGGGFPGFCRGPLQHLVSPDGNLDALHARLPVEVRGPFLPGHLSRLIPAGYFESAASGTNQIRDRRLAAYYDKILLATRAPLLSRDRWRAIYDLNLTHERRYRTSYLLADDPHPPWGQGGGPTLVDRWRAIEAPQSR